MPEYRIYRLSADDTILSAIEAECADDDEVRDMARASVEPGQQVEIWSGKRCLGKLLVSPGR